MGAGVYYLEGGDSVIIRGSDIHDNEDSDYDNFLEREFEFDCMVENILSILPKSYSEPWRDRYNSEGKGKVIAENGHHEVSIVDWYGDYYVCVGPRDDSNALAKANLYRSSGAIFYALSKRYKLRVRCSGYTTGPFDPSSYGYPSDKEKAA